MDGTLIQSFEFDEVCYLAAVEDVLGIKLSTDWDSYKHVTDTGLLMEYLENQNSVDLINDIEPKVKNSFIEKIRSHLNQSPASWSS